MRTSLTLRRETLASLTTDELAGVAGGDGDGPAGLGQRGVDPARDIAARIMRMTVGSQADIDRDGQAQFVCQIG